MKKWLSILILLGSSIAVTGFSWLDNLIVNKVLAIIFTIAFAFVGVLYNIGFLKNRSGGSKAFTIVAIILLLLCFVIYLGIRRFQEWAVNWPLYIKIVVISFLSILFVLVIIWRINEYIKQDVD